MALSDLDTASKNRLAKAARLIGIAVIAVGLIGGVLVALAPTEGTDTATRDNVRIGVFCCFGPALLTSIPVLLVGRLLRQSVHENDIGSLYRG